MTTVVIITHPFYLVDVIVLVLQNITIPCTFSRINTPTLQHVYTLKDFVLPCVGTIINIAVEWRIHVRRIYSFWMEQWNTFRHFHYMSSFIYAFRMWYFVYTMVNSWPHRATRCRYVVIQSYRYTILVHAFWSSYITHLYSPLVLGSLFILTYAYMLPGMAFGNFTMSTSRMITPLRDIRKRSHYNRHSSIFSPQC